jgi:anaphase-promoting complex subunit 7
MKLLLLFLAVPAAKGLLTAPATAPICHRSSETSRTRHQLFMSVPNSLDTLTSGIASAFRFSRGVTASPIKKEPRLMELYDVENDSACRAVRERITELDLSVQKVIPAAANSRVFLDSSYEYALPSNAEIPRLVAEDDNGGERVLEGASTIVAYLDEWTTKGGKNTQHNSSEMTGNDVFNALLGMGGLMANLFRLGRGVLVTEAASCDGVNVVPRPQQPLILYSYEGNQFCRLVREVLTELDIVYELRSAGKQSKRRDEVAKLSGGSTQSPFLIDPNTGVQIGQSSDIIQYLYRTYALWTPPSEVLQGISDILLPLFRPFFELLTPLQAGLLDNEKGQYEREIERAQTQIEDEITSEPIVIYTYALSPFSVEAKKLLDNLAVPYKEINLGGEWLPGLIGEGGSQKRAALLAMTGQSSLPNIFVGGKSIGGLFSGASSDSPGLVPLLEQGKFSEMVEEAMSQGLPSDVVREISKSSFEEEKLTKEKLKRVLDKTESSNGNVMNADVFW